MKVLLVLCVLASVTSVALPVSADTFKFDHDKGRMIEAHANSCASPKATKRLTDFVAKDLKITVGKGQMTVLAGDVTSSADRVINNVGEWLFAPDANGASLTVLVHVDTLGWCTEARTCAAHTPTVRVAIIQRYKGSECYEAWTGDGAKL